MKYKQRKLIEGKGMLADAKVYGQNENEKQKTEEKERVSWHSGMQEKEGEGECMRYNSRRE